MIQRISLQNCTAVHDRMQKGQNLVGSVLVFLNVLQVLKLQNNLTKFFKNLNSLFSTGRAFHVEKSFFLGKYLVV